VSAASHKPCFNNIGRSDPLGDSRHRAVFRVENSERLLVGIECLEFVPTTENETSAARAANNGKASHAVPPIFAATRARTFADKTCSNRARDHFITAMTANFGWWGGSLIPKRYPKGGDQRR
jgi:hypothetical protein